MARAKLTLGNKTTRKLTGKEKKTFKDTGGKSIKKKSFGRKLVDAQKKILTSTKTTAVLATVLGGGVGLGRAAAKKGLTTVARGKFPGGFGGLDKRTLASIKSGVIPRAEGDQLLKAAGRTRQSLGIGFTKGVPKSAAIAEKRGLSVISEIGQVGKSGKVVDLSKNFVDVKNIAKAERLSGGKKKSQAAALAIEIGKRRVNQVADRIVGSRFASNGKSQGLTKSFMVKLGLGIGAAGLAVSAIGTYPFAGFIREEAIQTLGFGFNTAKGTGDIEGMELALTETEELLNAEESIISKVPYANVISELRKFFDAARTKLEIDQRTFEEFSRDLEGEGEFESASERTGREIKERDEEQAEAQATRDKEFEQAQKDRDVAEAEELEFNREFFELIRAKRFDEAEALSKERERKLKGGN